MRETERKTKKHPTHPIINITSDSRHCIQKTRCSEKESEKEEPLETKNMSTEMKIHWKVLENRVKKTVQKAEQIHKRIRNKEKREGTQRPV